MQVGGDIGGGGETLHNTGRGAPVSDGLADVRLGNTSLGLTNKPKWVEYDRQVRDGRIRADLSPSCLAPGPALTSWEASNLLNQGPQTRNHHV